MNDLMQRIVMHHYRHEKCNRDICPFLITEFEAFQLLNELHFMFTQPVFGYPKPGDTLKFHGVTLVVVSDRFKNADNTNPA